MSYWNLAVNEPGQDGQAVLNATRRLSDDEYERLSDANQAFRRILGQTTWSVLQYSYSSFLLLEQQLREDIAARSTTVPIHADAIQVPIVASVVNFLTAMRMFLDQSETELKRLDKADDGNRFSAWKEVCSSEYDYYFAYRFLYRFRNYVQHVGLPLSIWNISVSLRQSDELVSLGLAGDSPLDHMSADEDLVVQIVLGESPSDLIENYDGWPAALKAELESLTTEIDLSEQIHIVMDCLKRVVRAFQEQFKEELAKGVTDFKEIVGNLNDYQHRPVLAHITEDSPRLTVKLVDLDFERFVQAERSIAGETA